MASVWLDDDDVPRRKLNSEPKEPLTQAIREEYGFNAIGDPLQAERDMTQACNIFLALLKDLKKYDSEWEVPDSRKLGTLIYYLYHRLMTAWKIEAKTRGDLVSEDFDRSYDKLGNEMKVLKKAFAIDESHYEELTSRTLLELVARIIAQKSDQALCLEHYAREFDSLEVVTVALRPAKAPVHVGIPKVIFICIHTTDSDKCDSGPWHIISTSRENWPSFKTWDHKALESWKKRIQNFGDTRDRTEEVWTKVEECGKGAFKRPRSSPVEKSTGEKWVEVVKRQWGRKKKDPKTRMIEARKAAIAELQEGKRFKVEKSSHCKEDRAAAFLIPGSGISGRCFKCQGLYPFTMHPDAKEDESTEELIEKPCNKDKKTGKLICKGYPAGSCAEVLAYPICKEVNVKYRTPKVVTAATQET